MKVIFRCDASLQIGTGHVMRCLTLADALAEQGAECHFICREHTGHLISIIQQRGHQVYSLPVENRLQIQKEDETNLMHADWLGSTQHQDAKLCRGILQILQPDWLVVDHYSLDVRWEEKLQPYYKKLMVIDDLADRQHISDILLDQTFGRDPQDYIKLVPVDCNLLCGADYALLRPEFAHWREYSLNRSEKGQLKHLLINLGGVDKDNVTIQILKAIQNSALPNDCRITVVMGSISPWVDVVQQQALLMMWSTEVKIGVTNMAELMANSDLAIGAAGSTSWERCCLGLPTIMLVLADNQKKIAMSLERAHAVHTVNLGVAFDVSILTVIERFISSSLVLKEMSQAASNILDGLGTNLIIKEMVT